MILPMPRTCPKPPSCPSAAVTPSKRSINLEAEWMKRHGVSLSCTHLDVKPLWWDAVLGQDTTLHLKKGQDPIVYCCLCLAAFTPIFVFPHSLSFSCPVFILSAWCGLQAVQGELRCSRRHLWNRDLAANLSFIVLHLANEGFRVVLLSGGISPEIGQKSRERK